MAGLSNLPPEFFMQLGGGILSGQNLGDGLGQGLQNASTSLTAQRQKQEETQQQSATYEALKRIDPEKAELFKSKVLTGPQAYSLFAEEKSRREAASKPSYDWMNIDGRLIKIDKNSGTIEEQADYSKGPDPTTIQRDLVAAGLQPGTPEFQKAILENYRKNGGQDDYANREAQALKLGIKPGDPRYESFILTGKLPREDQQTLTAVDKKAILEADDMVAVNQGAIDALKQAKTLSKDANSGWLSGTRATIGNNLPDYMVPDQISSPESSAATQNFDNAIVGQALTQLKAIFGGAPTEGERKILLDLQGSSNLQPEVRDKIIERAIAAAERRLEFNKQRADEMRGGTYYKPDSATSQQPASTSDGANTTSTGVKWKVPGQ